MLPCDAAAGVQRANALPVILPRMTIDPRSGLRGIDCSLTSIAAVRSSSIGPSEVATVEELIATLPQPSAALTVVFFSALSSVIEGVEVSSLLPSTTIEEPSGSPKGSSETREEACATLPPAASAPNTTMAAEIRMDPECVTIVLSSRPKGGLSLLRSFEHSYHK